MTSRSETETQYSSESEQPSSNHLFPFQLSDIIMTSLHCESILNGPAFSPNRLRKPKKVRCRTWMRRNSNESIQNKVYEVVEGATSLCFSDDGSWFQGNILPPKHCVYKIIGNRIDTVKETSTQVTPSPADSGYASPPKDPEGCKPGERQSYTSYNSTCSNSDSDLDPDLVQAVMDQWDLEDDDSDLEDGENPPNVEFYRVTVADFETGINYRLNGVKVIRKNSECEIKSDKLKFKSEKCLKGALADQALVNQMGPSFADQNLTVFKGDVTFKYQDQVCNPVNVIESKWCL